MRVQEIEGEVHIILQGTGDIAKMLSVLACYEYYEQDGCTKTFPNRLIERLEEELAQ